MNASDDPYPSEKTVLRIGRIPMIMIMDNTMNPQGRLECGAVVRHRNPLLCTMAHTAFYLFYRWNIACETPAFAGPKQCCAQQTGMHEMVVEALLIAIYSTWVTS
jgi:hypothetical protein